MEASFLYSFLFYLCATFFKSKSMSVKMRLARHGRKRYAYYHIVVADSRAPRDGRYIERIGSYNPLTNPATIELNFDRALDWLQKGAQPTDTCRAILSYKGVLYKNHLLIGVKKGAITMEQAEAKFDTWLKEKEGKIKAKIDLVENSNAKRKNERLEAEAKVREARAQAVAKKRAAEAEKEAKKSSENSAQNAVEANADTEAGSSEE